ncbi:hypothetical protein [Rubinisphaera sp.]|uniref:hypothetical protein n=1 Tax=Rubinisphaera sp. TaxID=2024857 RepID=UPI0025FBC473|nr:hypothetical protein [Rubinisphaera sp.]
MSQRFLLGQVDDGTRTAGSLCNGVSESANSRSHRDRIDLQAKFGLGVPANEDVY